MGVKLRVADSLTLSFLSLALFEPHNYSRTRLVSLGATLLDSVNPDQYRTWALAGIRAQLVDATKKRLEMDFVVEQAEHSIPVLNGVSPGFTAPSPLPSTSAIASTLQ